MTPSVQGDQVPIGQVGRVLGEGVQGRVHVERFQDGSVAAVKLVHEPEARAMLRGEGKALQRLADIDGVPALIGVRENPETFAPELVQEMYPGTSIEDAIEDGTPIPEGFWDDVERIMDEANRAGVYHTDLHTGNIIMRPDGSAGVIDWANAQDVGGGVLGRVLGWGAAGPQGGTAKQVADRLRKLHPETVGADEWRSSTGQELLQRSQQGLED